ncbi:MAG: nitrilase-related carbon-nitrogen hydrolase [Thermodesulfobacteriota bacterium]
MAKEVKIAVVQTGPAVEDKEQNIKQAWDQVADVAEKERPNFIVFPELFTTQFWCLGFSHQDYFAWAEPIPGPTTEMLGEKARKYQCHILAPIFEKGPLEGEYYNSAALIGPDGKVIWGLLPGGTKIPCARKNYISHFRWGDMVNDEKFYFRPGPGYPIFKTDLGTVGIIICYSRWYPESWRVLTLRGAELLFVPSASAGYVHDMWVCGFRTHAAENEVFAVGINKSGVERVKDKEARYYGMSLITGPDGRVIAQAPEGEPGVICTTVDMDEVRVARRRILLFRDRRPELYGTLTKMSDIID